MRQVAPPTLEQFHSAVVHGEYRFCPSKPRGNCPGCEIDLVRLLQDMKDVVDAIRNE